MRRGQPNPDSALRRRERWLLSDDPPDGLTFIRDHDPVNYEQGRVMATATLGYIRRTGGPWIRYRKGTDILERIEVHELRRAKSPPPPPMPPLREPKVEPAEPRPKTRAVARHVPRPLANHKTTRRRCLRCQEDFDSEGIHNRLCARCGGQAADASPLMDELPVRY